MQQLEGERGRQQEAPEDADSLWRSIDRLEQSKSTLFNRHVFAVGNPGGD